MPPPYVIDGRVKEKNVTPAAEKKWAQFLVNIKSMELQKAAESAVGTTSSTQFKKTGSQYQFRLSQKDRVNFVLSGNKLTQVQVGGHS
jgi:hypothetical protein